MIEIIQVIALLCQVPGGSTNRKWLERNQLKCQQEYIICIYNDKKTTSLDTAESRLKNCILEREIK